ncbi:MAG: sugar transferase [Candidatus Omnitrophica bacterium]|nr:sugar transferase [Candidatus Omnitrophota bacterium]
MFRLTKQKKFLYVAIESLIIAFSFFFPYFYRYNYNFSYPNFVLPFFNEYIIVYLVWILLLFIFLEWGGFYEIEREASLSFEIIRLNFIILVSSLIIASIIFLLKFTKFSRLVFVLNIIFLSINFSLWRIFKRVVIRQLIKSGYIQINALIVGTNRAAMLLLEEIEKRPFLGIKIKGFLDDSKKGFIKGTPILGKLKDFLSVCRKNFIDEIFITISSAKDEVSYIMKEARKLKVGLRLIPENFEEWILPARVGFLGILPLLTYKEKKIYILSFSIKRLLDRILAFLLILFLSPLFFLIAFFIKLDSPGPVFIFQERGGRRGKIFKMYKFRSMVKDAPNLRENLEEKNEVKGGVLFKIKNDPRITKVGRFLRRYSLDELPQLLNVLLGDMSLVGPRPFFLDEIKKLGDEYLLRLDFLPGITGLAQVRGRSDLSFYRWIKWDLWYVNNWSLGLDLKILWWTIPAVINAKGAY